MKNSCIVSQRPANNLPDKFNVIIPPQDIGMHPDYLERLAGGDRGAYAWVYKNYCKKVYDYAMLMTRNEALSEDVVQEVFLKVWQNKEKLKSVENFNAYLYMLYRNYILDALERRQKEMIVIHEYCRDAEINTIAEDVIYYKETQQVIAKAVKNLPQQQRLVYRLSRDYGWKRDQISKGLKITPNTVKAHMQNALRFLRARL